MKFVSSTAVEEVSINLTPLIDVVFLLLIFFMVSTTFDTTSQLKITLPEASDRQSTKAAEKLKIVIDTEGRFYLNSRELSSKKSAALMAAVKRALNGLDLPVVIQSDAESPVQSLVTAMDVIGKLGLTQVSIATTRPLD